MNLAERFLKRIFQDVLERCPEEMAFFNQRIDDTVIATLQSIVASSFVRLSYTEAYQRRSGHRAHDRLYGVRQTRAMLREAGFSVVDDGLKIEWSPTEEGRRQCEEYGSRLARAFAE